MSAGDDSLMPEIGTLAAIREAVEYVSLSLSKRRPAGSVVEAVDDGNELSDLVVALVQLSAVLAMGAAGYARRSGTNLDAVDLVRSIGRDQEIHAARRLLGGLEGIPFDDEP